MEVKIEKGHSKRMHKFLIREYLSIYGYTEVGLAKYSVPLFFDPDIKLFRKRMRPKNSNMVVPYPSHLLKALESKGYMIFNDKTSCFYMTQAGFCEGLKAITPIRSFFKEYWKVVVPIITGFGIVFVGVLNYLKTN